MRFLFYLLLLLLPLGRVLNQALYDTDRKTIPLAPISIVVALLMMAWCARRFKANRVRVNEVPGFGAIALFLLWACVSLIINQAHFDLDRGQTLISGLYLFRWVQYALLYFIVYELASERSQAHRIVHWLFAGGLTFCAFGFFQSIFLPDFALWLYPDARPYIDYDPQGHRLVSTILDPNIAAGYILIFAVIALSFYVQGLRRWLPVFIVLTTALLLTLSRGGLLGFLVGATVLLWNRGSARKRVVWALLLLVTLSLAVYPMIKPEIAEASRFSIEDSGALGRIDNWLLLINIIKDNPLTGIGFDTLGFVGPNYGIVREGGLAFGLEGDLLMILAMTGIIGFVLYGRMLWRMLTGLRNLAACSNDLWDKAFGLGVQAALWAIVVSSCFTNLLLYPEVMAVLWILWSLAESLHKAAKAPRAPLAQSS